MANAMSPIVKFCAKLFLLMEISLRVVYCNGAFSALTKTSVFKVSSYSKTFANETYGCIDSISYCVLRHCFPTCEVAMFIAKSKTCIICKERDKTEKPGLKNEVLIVHPSTTDMEVWVSPDAKYEELKPTNVIAAFNFKLGSNNLIEATNQTHTISPFNVEFDPEGAVFDASSDYLAVSNIGGYFGYKKEWSVWIRYKETIDKDSTGLFSAHKCSDRNAMISFGTVELEKIYGKIHDADYSWLVYEKTNAVVPGYGNWTDILISFNGYRFTFYLNSTLIGERDINTNMATYVSPRSPDCFHIGNYGAAPYNTYLSGRISCFGVAASFVQSEEDTAQLFSSYC